MTRRTWILAGIVVAIPVLALAWWLGSPLFLDQEVDEGVPDVGRGRGARRYDAGRG